MRSLYDNDGLSKLSDEAATKGVWMGEGVDETGEEGSGLLLVSEADGIWMVDASSSICSGGCGSAIL